MRLCLCQMNVQVDVSLHLEIMLALLSRREVQVVQQHAEHAEIRANRFSMAAPIRRCCHRLSQQILLGSGGIQFSKAT